MEQDEEEVEVPRKDSPGDDTGFHVGSGVSSPPFRNSNSDNQT
jgi:hypothetical protein